MAEKAPNPKDVLIRHCQMKGLEKPIYATGPGDAPDTYVAEVSVVQDGQTVAMKSEHSFQLIIAAEASAARKLLEAITTPTEQGWLEQKVVRYVAPRDTARELKLFLREKGWPEPRYEFSSADGLCVCRLHLRKSNGYRFSFEGRAPSHAGAKRAAARLALKQFGRYNA